MHYDVLGKNKNNRTREKARFDVKRVEMGYCKVRVKHDERKREAWTVQMVQLGDFLGLSLVVKKFKSCRPDSSRERKIRVRVTSRD